MARARTAMMMLAAGPMALILTTATPAGAATDPLGLDALNAYNLVVLGDLNSSSEVEGRTFVGGNLVGNSSNYQISAAVPASTYTVPGLTVVGNVTGGTKNLNNGSGAVIGGNVSSGFNLNGPVQTVQVGGSISNTNVNQNTVVSGLNASNPAFSQNLTQYGSALGTSMIGLSYQLGQLPPTASVAMNGSTGVFTVPSTPGSPTVFTLTASQLAGMSAIQFNTNGANLVVVNVTGASVALSQNFLGGTNNLGQSVIWNFPDATALSLTTAWGGSVLAPRATATTANYIQGSAVFGSLTQNGEMHIGTLGTGYVLPASPIGTSTTSSTSSGSGAEVPEPGMGALFAVGLAVLVWWRRRRSGVALASL
ncbi:choice-of-anchor A family protein [Novosphingobium sp.]|uniref:choice-of-anchor A family protein n=1 Tax=Novosphingobium sp. TaxID=1874826 RepID=UPI00333F00F1